MLIREYENGLEDLSPMTSNAWFHYVEYKSNGFFAAQTPVLGKSFEKFKRDLVIRKDAFERLCSDHIKSIKMGLPDMPPEDEPEDDIDHAFV